MSVFAVPLTPCPAFRRGSIRFGSAAWGGTLLGIGILIGRRLETYSRRTVRAARTAVRKGV